ncbi:MAG: Gldg family protein [Candidatus Cloacimonetes bacterium]|nr:Gldg family protein [Candidatus Cloacimonadota bacterium]
MNTRSQILGTYAIKILIAILVLILAGFIHFRLDLSRNRSHSLSQATKSTLRELQDKVVVKVFASPELPQELNSLNRSLKDMLAEFQAQSRGKFRFDYVKAGSTGELIEQAQKVNIPPYTTTSVEADKMVSKEVVFGAAFEGGGKSASLLLRPGMDSMLEYQLLKQINKLKPDTLPEIGVFADTLALMYQYSYYQDNLATFFMELLDNYKIEHLNLETAPKQMRVLLCLGVVDSLSDLQLYHLDQYLMRGGQVVMIQDRAMVSFSNQGTAVTELDSNLFRMLEKYGIEIKPNIVLDRECELVGDGLGHQVPYPFFPRLKPNSKYPYAAGFDPIVMNIASQIGSMPGSQLKMEPVLQTSGKSNTLEGPVFMIEEAVKQALEPGYLDQPPVVVAAEFSGRFTSFFSQALTDSTFHSGSDQARIILFGDSDFNLEFGAGAFIIMNAIDHLLGRDDMVKLRSPRSNYNRLGAEVYMSKHQIRSPDPEKKYTRLNLVFKLTAILLPVLLLALAGFALAHRRS